MLSELEVEDSFPVGAFGQLSFLRQFLQIFAGLFVTIEAFVWFFKSVIDAAHHKMESN